MVFWIMKTSNKIKIGDEVELEVHGEICCDLCNFIEHNHIDCPVCETQYASTDKYCDLHEEEELMCENCKTVFAKTSESWYWDCKVRIISLK